MKYCAKCGKEISEEAVICMNCGCLVEGKQYNYSQASSGKKKYATETIIKQPYRLLGWQYILIYGLMGLSVLGAVMMEGWWSLSCIWFGIGIGLFMVIPFDFSEKRMAAKRAEISASKNIIAEGNASRARSFDSGWLFVTSEGVEYYPSTMNLNRRTLVFSKAEVQSIYKEGRRLVIVAQSTKYVFTVSYVDSWLQVIRAYKA